MSRKTRNYRLKQFESGAYYSATEDYKRFVTLDYNLESYIGITGVGIIDGWDINAINVSNQESSSSEDESLENGLNIEIFPGRGIIGGYFSESDYVYKKRSEMTMGDIEIDVINTSLNQLPEPDLTEQEQETYIEIIQSYNPSYDPNPDEPIENAFVKTSRPEILILQDNRDNFIYAERKHNTFYPNLNDYQHQTLDEPSQFDFEEYSDYTDAKDAYDAELAIIHQYEWMNNSDNHFTTVRFNSYPFQFPGKDRLLIGKVVTRNGEISAIDIKGVQIVKNIESKIRNYSSQELLTHKHGGRKSNDPARIILATDVRPTILKSRRGNTTTYQVLKNTRTTTTLNHYHSYSIDGNGNGYTLQMLGESYPLHFHRVTNYEVQENVFLSELSTGSSAGDISKSHIHELVDLSENDKLDISTNIIVYNNGIQVNPSDVVGIFPSDNTISLKNIPVSFNTYSMRIESLVGYDEPFNYSSVAVNLLSFVLSAIQVFWSQFPDLAHGWRGTDQNGEPHDDDPFTFWDDKIEIDSSMTVHTPVGIDHLIEQCNIGESLLRNSGERFTLTPLAARNVTIELTSVAAQNNITVESLGRGEIQGKLHDENIVFINANKIKFGIIDIARIPLLDHIGRFNEKCFPLPQSMISRDGIMYNVVPRFSSIELGHQHDLSINLDGQGTTTNAIVDSLPLYYTSHGSENFFIHHTHGISNFQIGNQTSQKLIEWHNLSQNESLDLTSAHNHEILYTSVGDPKTIYNIDQDTNQDIYAATPMGMMVVPNEDVFVFIINNERIVTKTSSSNMIELFEYALEEYTNKTEDILPNQESYYSQIENADLELANHNDSKMIVGQYARPYNEGSIVDNIIIQRQEYYFEPDFYYNETKVSSDIANNEMPVKLVSYTKGENGEKDVLIYDTIGDISGFPINHVNIVTVGQNNDLRYLVCTNQYLFVGVPSVNRKKWYKIRVSDNVRKITKSILDPNYDLWTLTDRGIFNYHGFSESDRNILMNRVSIGTMNSEVNDIAYANGYIYAATNNGLFSSNDRGASWNLESEIVGKRLLVDSKSHYVSDEGHVHDIVVDKNGNGYTDVTNNHNHLIRNWNIGQFVIDDPGGIIPDEHSHFILSDLYMVDLNNRIYSYDSGWDLILNLPPSEIGAIVVFDGAFYFSDSNATYRLQDDIQTYIANRAYSITESNDLSELLIGSHDTLYKNNNPYLTISGSPNVVLIVNDEQKHFGYNYHLNTNSVNFDKFSYFGANDNVGVMSDATLFPVKNGGWDINDKYEIFINNKLIYSNIKNIDLRGIESEYFQVLPEQGNLDFGGFLQIEQTLRVSDIGYGDFSINLGMDHNFRKGDKIHIKTLVEPAPQPIPDLNDPNFDIREFNIVLDEWLNRTMQLKEMQAYYIIDDVGHQTITTRDMATIIIESPFKITKISQIDSNDEITIDIYGSNLSNIGLNTHDNVEDQLSIHSDTRPYKLNNAYLSNFLQLTQAIRYVFPSISDNHINNKFYDFRYGWDGDGIYPSIYDDIDVDATVLHSPSLYDSEYVTTSTPFVNIVLFGTGNFNGILLAGTNVGLFVASITDGMNADWFCVNNSPDSIYDIFIQGGKRIYIGSGEGVFYSDDIYTWTKDNPQTLPNRINKIISRWAGNEIVVIDSHSAIVYNELDESTTLGYIKYGSIIETSEGISLSSDSSEPIDIYNDIEVNRIIRISGTDVIDGEYSVVAVLSDTIVVQGGFGNIDGIMEVDNITITMGSWWDEYADGEYVGGTENIPSFLTAGGINYMGFKRGDNPWNQGFIFDTNAINIINRFDVSGIIAKRYGTLIASVNSVDSRYIASTNNLGETWETVLKRSSETFDISSYILDHNNNTVIKVVSDSIVNKSKEHFYNNKVDLIADGNSVESSIVIWTDKNEITVKGSSFYNYMVVNSGEFKCHIEHPLLNTISHDDNLVFLGTDNGLYTDRRTLRGAYLNYGNFLEMGDRAFVITSDLQGETKSATTVLDGIQISITITNNKKVNRNSLKDQHVYFSGINDAFVINSNTASTSGEFNIIIAANNINLDLYRFKKIYIVPENSELVIESKSLFEPSEYDGGYFYAIDQGAIEFGVKYEILFISRNLIVTKNQIGFQNELNGKEIIFVYGDEKIKARLKFDLPSKDNEYSDMMVSSLFGNKKIINHSSNEMLLSIKNSSREELSDLFYTWNRFYIIGKSLYPVGNFQNKRTSTDDDHYHDVYMMNGVMRGDIDFVSISENEINFMPSNIIGWDNILNDHPSLLNNVKITFWHPTADLYRVTETVDEFSETNIKIISSNPHLWNNEGSGQRRISVGWKYEIDTTYHGITENTNYVDFKIYQQNIFYDINIGDNEITLNSTALLSQNDKVVITDKYNNVHNTFIADVVDATTISISASSPFKFHNRNSVRIKILSSNFTNDHIHYVQYNQVDLVSVSDYNDIGYSLYHSHLLEPGIKNVSSIAKYNDKIVVAGNSSHIYERNNDDWEIMVDINNSDNLNPSEYVNNITAIGHNDIDIVVGTSNGRVFYPNPNTNTPLIKP